MAIGRDLLDLPFAEMVRNLAIAIADGQTALDRNSLDTLHELVNTEVDVMTEIVETISPDVHDVDGITVTGASIESSGLPSVRMNMFQAGLAPTFYQFTEANIEVRLSITMREEQRGTAGGRTSESSQASFGFLGLGFSRAYASTVDYRTSNAYDYAAQGASVLRATMKPVPPPSRISPAITTVNTFVAPPLITRTER